MHSELKFQAGFEKAVNGAVYHLNNTNGSYLAHIRNYFLSTSKNTEEIPDNLNIQQDIKNFVDGYESLNLSGEKYEIKETAGQKELQERNSSKEKSENRSSSRKRSKSRSKDRNNSSKTLYEFEEAVKGAVCNLNNPNGSSLADIRNYFLSAVKSTEEFPDCLNIQQYIKNFVYGYERLNLSGDKCENKETAGQKELQEINSSKEKSENRSCSRKRSKTRSKDSSSKPLYEFRDRKRRCSSSTKGVARSETVAKQLVKKKKLLIFSPQVKKNITRTQKSAVTARKMVKQNKVNEIVPLASKKLIKKKKISSQMKKKNTKRYQKSAFKAKKRSRETKLTRLCFWLIASWERRENSKFLLLKVRKILNKLRGQLPQNEKWSREAMLVKLCFWLTTSGSRRQNVRFFKKNAS